MRGFLVSFVVVVATLVVGCGEIDMVVDGSAAPDAGILPGDGGPMFGDAGPMMGDGGPMADAGSPVEDTGVGVSDTGVVASDAGVDASADAAVASATCGNAVLDPGEVCDPGTLVYDDAGLAHAVVFPGARAMCPDADCARVACPDGGAVVRDSYCIYLGTSAPSWSTGAQPLSWQDVAEREAQFAAIRAQLPADSMGRWVGMIALHHIGAFPGGTWYWEPPYWATGRVPTDLSTLPAWGDGFATGPYARLYLGASDATMVHEPGTAGSVFYMVFGPNAR